MAKGMNEVGTNPPGKGSRTVREVGKHQFRSLWCGGTYRSVTQGRPMSMPTREGSVRSGADAGLGVVLVS